MIDSIFVRLEELAQHLPDEPEVEHKPERYRCNKCDRRRQYHTLLCACDDCNTGIVRIHDV